MSSAWICFECREAVGRNASFNSEPISCPKCKGKTRYLSYKVPVPKKRDIQAWKQLWQEINQRKQKSIEQNLEWKVKRIHEYEKQIRDLENKKFCKGREKQIHQLRNGIAYLK